MVICQKDSLCLVITLPVPRVVEEAVCPDTVRSTVVRRNHAVPAEAAPVAVGDELGCPAGVFFIEVRPHHSAPP